MRPTGGTAARRPRLVRLDPLRAAARGRGARGDPIIRVTEEGYARGLDGPEVAALYALGAEWLKGRRAKKA